MSPRTAERADLESVAAVTVRDDPRRKALDLRDLHRRWAETATVPEGVRTAIARAWSRQAPRPSTAPGGHLPDGAVAERRSQATELRTVLPHLETALLDVASEASNELVVCDADGVVLWVRGPAPVRRSSERLGFVEGACWSEDAVGTNGLGTAIVDARPIQVFGAEHTDEGHHGWVCSGAPIISPRTGAPAGAITLSGPLASAHPNTVALVSGAVRLAEQVLALEHRADLDRVRRSAGDLGGAGPVVLVDDDGWVVQAEGVSVGERVWLPGRLHEGDNWAPSLGAVQAQRVPGGWALRPVSTSDVRLELHAGPSPRAVVRTGDQGQEVRLTARHAAIMLALAAHPEGVSGEQLADAAYDRPVSLVTLRAEVSRLRGRLGPMIDTRPYRLTVPCEVLVGPTLTARRGIGSQGRTGSGGLATSRA